MQAWSSQSLLRQRGVQPLPANIQNTPLKTFVLSVPTSAGMSACKGQNNPSVFGSLLSAEAQELQKHPGTSLLGQDRVLSMTIKDPKHTGKRSPRPSNLKKGSQPSSRLPSVQMFGWLGTLSAISAMSYGSQPGSQSVPGSIAQLPYAIPKHPQYPRQRLRGGRPHEK